MSELAIRARRAAFNQALAEGDLAAIGPLLAPNAILVTGSDSAIISGRKAQLAAWKREFAASNPTIYTRAPTEVVISSAEPIALETGQWQGVDKASAMVTAAGRYTAKWRNLNDHWVLIAEIFVTLA